MSVDFPAPFSPTMAWTSAGMTTRWTSSLARTPGNRLLIPSSSAAGAVSDIAPSHEGGVRGPPAPDPSSAFDPPLRARDGDLSVDDPLLQGVQLALDVVDGAIRCGVVDRAVLER